MSIAMVSAEIFAARGSAANVRFTGASTELAAVATKPRRER
jgi:hypothetical protein